MQKKGADKVENFLQYMLDASKYALIILSVVMIARCVISMLSSSRKSEVWGYIRFGDSDIPLLHWENLIGRSPSSDVRIKSRAVGRLHAVIRRLDNGEWRIFNVFSKNQVFVDNEEVGPKGLVLKHNSSLRLGNCPLVFRDISAKQRKAQEEILAEQPALSQFWTLFTLTLFQLCLLCQHFITADREYAVTIALGFP